MKKIILLVCSIVILAMAFTSCGSLFEQIPDTEGLGNVSTPESPDNSDNPENSDKPGASEGVDGAEADFTAEEKQLFLNTFGFVIPFIDSREYYVEEYEQDYGDGYEWGVNFYSYGNTQTEFNAYIALFSKYDYTGEDTDEYGDIWYYYDNGSAYIDISYYDTGDGYVIDVYVYYLEDNSSGGSGSGSGSGGSSQNSDVITNEGVGLPSDADGIYEIVITDTLLVPNVTGQGYYLDGCPTTGSPKVLVIPIEFSDATANSKGFSVSNIVKAFTGGAGETEYYSVRDYYYISSYGKLDLDITVVGDWFRPQHTSSYYASQTVNMDGNEVEIGDQMILDEALKYLDGKMDLSEFDTDNNECIDAVVLINTLTINQDEIFYWAYRYWNTYTDSSDYYYEYDGVSANDYLWMSYQFLYETTDEWGNVSFDDEGAMNTYTYIHEFGHLLGADDYYDTSGTGEGPLRGLDVMDSTTGDHNPYSKLNYGWITETRLIVADKAISVELSDFTKTGDFVIIANNWSPGLGAYQEYYIVMYYTQNGLNSGGNGYFDRNGILVYHVNASLYKEEYGGEAYYDVYNSNTAPQGDPEYGTEDNLIEFVTARSGSLMFFEGDSLPTVYDDLGNKLGHTFTVNSIEAEKAILTFAPVN